MYIVQCIVYIALLVLLEKLRGCGSKGNVPIKQLLMSPYFGIMLITPLSQSYLHGCIKC